MTENDKCAEEFQYYYKKYFQSVDELEKQLSSKVQDLRDTLFMTLPRALGDEQTNPNAPRDAIVGAYYILSDAVKQARELVSAYTTAMGAYDEHVTRGLINKMKKQRLKIVETCTNVNNTMVDKFKRRAERADRLLTFLTKQPSLARILHITETPGHFRGQKRQSVSYTTAGAFGGRDIVYKCLPQFTSIKGMSNKFGCMQANKNDKTHRGLLGKLHTRPQGGPYNTFQSKTQCENAKFRSETDEDFLYPCENLEVKAPK